jgi:hypothetical protein
MSTKIVQCGYMTGDTYTAAALLAADADTRIILLIDKEASGAQFDKSDQIRRIYSQTGVLGQITVIDITGRASIKDIWRQVGDANHKFFPPRQAPSGNLPDVARELIDAKPSGEWPHTITHVTHALADQWGPEACNAVARAWSAARLPAEKRDRVRAFISRTFNHSTLSGNVVALWSRQSGKRGGAHAELDSSFEGIRQLAELFTQGDAAATVLLCGDERNAKMESIAASMPRVFSIAEIWKDPDWIREFGNQSFLAQLAFFQYLSETSKVVHIGMRSGMLEPMALLGMQVFYLENQGSRSGGRMLAFIQNNITYERLKIQLSPGLGGYAVSQSRNNLPESAQAWIEEKAAAVKRNQDFRASVRSLGWSSEEADRTARRFAKAQIASDENHPRYEDYSCNSLEQLKGNMATLRGFMSGDLDKISRHVTNALAQP